MNGVAAMAAQKRISPEITFNISFREGADGYVVAECIDLPGCISQGVNREEAMDNLEDVIRTCCALILRKWMKEARAAEQQHASRRTSAELDRRREAFRLYF